MMLRSGAWIEPLGWAVGVVVESRVGSVSHGQASGFGILGKMRGARVFRVGHGSDTHRLVDGRRLVLGGVEVPFERGLLGHSDADVVLHALTDALLGAAGLGDIGEHFPDTDERWKDANSGYLLEAVVALLRVRGWRVANCDLTIHAQLPKLGPHKEAIRANVARLLGVEAERVNVKAKTGEHVGPIGRGEAMGADAVALIEGAGS